MSDDKPIKLELTIDEAEVIERLLNLHGSGPMRDAAVILRDRIAAALRSHKVEANPLRAPWTVSPMRVAPGGGDHWEVRDCDAKCFAAWLTKAQAEAIAELPELRDDRDRWQELFVEVAEALFGEAEWEDEGVIDRLNIVLESWERSSRERDAARAEVERLLARSKHFERELEKCALGRLDALEEVERLRSEQDWLHTTAMEARGQNFWDKGEIEQLRSDLARVTAERDACREAMEAWVKAVAEDGTYAEASRLLDRARDLLRRGEAGEADIDYSAMAERSATVGVTYRLKQAVEALRQYADPENWGYLAGNVPCPRRRWMRHEWGYTLAQEALAKVEGGGDENV